jgi:hypothetical protein
MTEVPLVGEDHGDVALVAGADGLVVAPRSARLDDRRYAGGRGGVGAVAEREVGF